LSLELVDYAPCGGLESNNIVSVKRRDRAAYGWLSVLPIRPYGGDQRSSVG